MRFSTVLFDLDGTLINTNELIIASYDHVFRTCLNLTIPRETIRAHIGETLMNTMASYDANRAQELCDFYRTFNLEHHDRLIERYEGVQEAIHQLHAAGVKLAVVTSKHTQLARRGLELAGLHPYFDLLIGVDQVEKPKPDPESIYVACEKLGVQPGPEILMMGDTHFDIRTGRNAGVKTICVGWTIQDRAELEALKPDFWVEQPHDLVRLVLGE
ncbi:MAG TPA: pyrophosphatase PpaX [Symbiobacteriaceae bacterium]|nr:pyrophosphatase PpaX [Symbiobacteriaceae bacterium]